MNFSSWLVWGFASTVLLTTLAEGSRGLGLTRMSLPYLLGTMLTPDRERAKVYGALLHFLNGWLFSLLYVAAFHAVGLATWWFGALVGLVQSAFVLVVAMPLLPGMHPRMASEQGGPTVVKQLEPPGFVGRHYGSRTPLSVLVSHLVFGGVLGGFYTL